jgi:D-beta-D-heptose 7-phosphate kinase/D-beta-D-heptose 1-phosphate adenosyltransferase
MSLPSLMPNFQPSIIWVNGCFDVMHMGHIEMLKYAKSLGQTLIVGTDTDERVKSNKGPTRPLNNLALRVSFLEAIRYVDTVVTFGSDEQLNDLIRFYNADTMVVGEEYKGRRIVGGECVKNIIFYPKQYGLSTTKLINQQ